MPELIVDHIEAADGPGPVQDEAMATKKKTTTTTKKATAPKKKSSEETKRPSAGKPRNPFGEKQKPTWLDRR